MNQNESSNGPNATLEETGTPEGVRFFNTDGALSVYLDAFDSATLQRAQKAIASRWFRDGEFKGADKLQSILVDFEDAEGSNRIEVQSQLIAPLRQDLPRGGHGIISFIHRKELADTPQESVKVEGIAQMSGVTIRKVRDTLEGNA